MDNAPLSRVPTECGAKTTGKLTNCAGAKLCGSEEAGSVKSPDVDVTLSVRLVVIFPLFVTVTVPCWVDPAIVFGKRIVPLFCTDVITPPILAVTESSAPVPVPDSKIDALLICRLPGFGPGVGKGVNVTTKKRVWPGWRVAGRVKGALGGALIT